MLSAKEARKLSGPTVEEIVEAELERVELKIKAEAEKKRRCVHLHDDIWTNGGYGNTKEWQAAKTALEKAGYKVKFFYEERQFVNMYTIVEW